MDLLEWLLSKSIKCVPLARICIATIIMFGAILCVDAKGALIERPAISSVDEEMKLVDITRDYWKNEGLREFRQRLGWTFLTLFSVLLFVGLGLRMRECKNDSVSNVSRLMYFSAAILLSVYIGFGIYFDFLIGETSSYSTSGAHIVERDETLIFWVIVITKIAASIISAYVGIRLLRHKAK